MSKAEAWYKELRSQDERKRLARCFNTKQPPYEHILAHLAVTGRSTETLRRWLDIAGYDVRDKDKFIEALEKLYNSREEGLLMVEAFDSELAKQAISKSKNLEITIYAPRYLDAILKAWKDSERKQKKYTSKASRARKRRKSASDSQNEIKDSSAPNRNSPTDRIEKNISSKGNILFEQALGDESNINVHTPIYHAGRFK